MFKFAQNESDANRSRIFFYAVDATDGFTMVTTGLSISTAVTLTKNGVTPAIIPLSPSFTHISNGLWYYEFPALSGYLDTVGVLTVTIQDALIRTVQLIGYVYSGDPLASSSITAAGVWSYGTRDLTGNVTVGTINSGVITATSIASNAITSAKIADTSLTAAKFGDSALVIGSAAAGGVKAYLDAGSITAGVIATNAIDADALATDAVTEIGTGVWTTDISAISTSGQAGLYVTNINVDTSNTYSSVTTIEGTAYKESVADILLGRNVGGGSNAGRLVKEALYALRNKSEISGNQLNVYNATDGAISWSATVSSSASADPVTGIDP
jgi:hypothetical protein